VAVEVEDSSMLDGIPREWTYMPLGKLIAFGPQNGISPTKSTDTHAPRAITLTATTSGRFDASHYKRVAGSFAEDSKYWLRSGDLLFQRGNTADYVGMAAYYVGADHQFLYPDLMIMVRLVEEMDLRFVHLCSIAPHARAYLKANAAGAQATMPKINQGTLVRLPIPVPPLAEQRRIVAKVAELMAVCDQLEQSLTTEQTQRARLLEALLHGALGKSTSDPQRELLAIR